MCRGKHGYIVCCLRKESLSTIFIWTLCKVRWTRNILVVSISWIGCLHFSAISTIIFESKSNFRSNTSFYQFDAVHHRFITIWCTMAGCVGKNGSNFTEFKLQLYECWLLFSSLHRWGDIKFLHQVFVACCRNSCADHSDCIMVQVVFKGVFKVVH